MKLDLAELKRIASRSADINTDLDTQLNAMKNNLNDICTNVRSSELTEANNNLTKSIENIVNRLSTNLPQIIEFLNSQVSAYEQTNVEAKSQVDTLVSSINETFGA